MARQVVDQALGAHRACVDRDKTCERVSSSGTHSGREGHIWQSPCLIEEERLRGKINLGRVVLGGLVAGVIVDVVEYVINNIVLAEQWHSLTAAKKMPTLGIPEAVAFDIIGLIIGLAAVWTYAAIRPRFGAGPRTAVIAGLLTWITAYVLNDLAPLIFGTFGLTMFSIQIAAGSSRSLWRRS